MPLRSLRNLHNSSVYPRIGGDEKDILRLNTIAVQYCLSRLQIALNLRTPHPLGRPVGAQWQVLQIYPVDRHKPTCASRQFHSERSRVARSIDLDDPVLLDAIGKKQGSLADSNCLRLENALKHLEGLLLE